MPDKSGHYVHVNKNGKEQVSVQARTSASVSMRRLNFGGIPYKVFLGALRPRFIGIDSKAKENTE